MNLIPANKSWIFFISIYLSVFFLVGCRSTSDDIKTIPDSAFSIPNKREFELSSTIPACENFYNHVCKNEIKKFYLPESRNRYIFSFDDSQERIKNQRISFLNSLSNQINLSPRKNMIKAYYDSCLNVKSRKNEEFKYVQDQIKSLNLLNHTQLLQSFAEESIKGKKGLIDVSESINPRNPNKKDILLSYSLNLQIKELYENAELLTDYKNLIEIFFKSLNINNANNMANFIVNFEKNISHNYPTLGEFREMETQENSVDRDKIVSLYPNLYLDIILNKIPKSITINNMIPKTFLNINQELSNTNTEKLRSLALWHNLSDDIIKYSYPNYYQEKEKFKNKYFGTPNINESLIDLCINSTSDTLERNMDYELINIYYRNFPAQRVKNLVYKIKETTLESMKKNTWLSTNAKQKAILKINKISVQILKPDNLKDWNLEKTTTLDSNYFIANNEIIRENKFFKMLNEISLRRNKNEWSMSPLEINAYYEPTLNQFVMPLGILQPPFFDPEKSDMSNLGAFGMVVAHEIGHSVDDQGSRYDENGVLAPWMNESDLEKFKEKTEKIKMLFEKNGVDSQLTLGENIADFVGITNSFRTAFPNPNKTNILEQKQFFIQYARNWCGVETEKVKEILLKTDPHAPIELRVNAQMKLSKNFEKAFSCKKRDNMTLDEKDRITLW